MYVTGFPETVVTEESSGETFRNRFIGVDGALCGAGAAARGVSQDGNVDGETIPVALEGAPIVECGDQTVPIVNDSPIASDADGKAVVAGTGDIILGYARVPATQSTIVAGNLVRVKLTSARNVSA